jgi:hypothetical protein
MAGIPRANWLVSLTMAMSAFRQVAIFGDEIGEVGEPISSSPSMRRVRLTGQAPVLVARRNGLDVGPDLALIVGGAAGMDGVVADGGLKWGRGPQVQGLGGWTS